MGKPAGQEQQTLSLRLLVIPLSASSVSHIYKRRKAPGRNVPGPFVCTLPTGWACNWPEPTSRNRCTAFCAAVSFFAGFRARRTFSQIFHILFFRRFCNSTVSSRHSSITAPFQKRFKQSLSIYHIFPFCCLFMLFVGIIFVFFGYSIHFWYFFKHSPPC